ncbi:unnamed protein product [Toxocara canis]|uniref:Sulfate_transp domain-containing protein n=1 Tax=Toxocara canis TaxID=6265 RepID=A0A183U3F9_TOXCA|nr:unnamed protein product [Toxocara canis]
MIITSVSCGHQPFELLTAICCLEFVTKYFSDTLVSGFTTGAAVHVAVGQLNVVLGINVKSVGNMHIFERIANIIAGIPEANPYVVITSLCSMLFIYIGKEFIDPPVRRRSKAIQIPYELILIVAGTVISYTMKLQDDFHVRCVGNIPVGMPRPQMPRFDLISECLADALAIAALSIAIHISMAKMLAKKLKYNIDAGQVGSL